MAKPANMVLSVLHAGRKDRMVMRSLINLVSGRAGGATWQLSEEAGGDITIIDVDNAAGEQAWQQLIAHTGGLVAMTGRDGFDAPVTLNKPLRSREFLNLLAGLSGEPPRPRPWPAAVTPAVAGPLGDGPVPEKSSTVSKAGPAAPVGLPESESEPELTLADHLRGQSWPGPVALTSPGWPLLLIDPCSGSWFYDGSIGDLDPACFARPIPSSAGVGLSNSELVERIQGHRQRSLSELKWYAGLAQLPGRLHPELRGEPEFMLTQVPPEAMKNELLHQLARLALRGPIDFERLLAESGQPEANVAAFLNACFCSGKLLINRTARAISF